MKYYYDIHIHSCLSACADSLMTPNNIMNMAMLKKLDIIAVTDHNSAKQLKAIQELSKSYDFLVIPGIEISVAENFHMLVYFKTFEDAISFGELIEQFIVKEPFDESIHGEQLLMDEFDTVTGKYPYLLSRELTIGYKEVLNLLKRYEHIAVPAHVNRYRHTGIGSLNDMDVHVVEVTKNNESDDFIKKHGLSKYFIIHNSDSHQIINIHDRLTFNGLELESKTIDAFFKYFNG